MHNCLLAFIPIFVAVDAIGLLPVFISLTYGLDKQVKKKVIGESILTALCLAIGFIFLGRAVFKLLGITIGDFMVAGGLILFCIAVMDILTSGKERLAATQEFGVVPLGTPLLVGPAVLTTSVILIDQYGLFPTIFSILANILFTVVLFSFSDVLIKVVGEGGSRALSKVMSLLLAAIAVMMIRKGIGQILSG